MFDKIVRMFVRGIKKQFSVPSAFSPGVAISSEDVFIKIYAWRHDYFFKDITFCGLLWEWDLVLKRSKY